MRHRNDGLKKRCEHKRREWARCACSWHFNFKPRGGTTHYRVSLDRHMGRHIGDKTEAQEIAATIRAEIRAGTFGVPAPREGMTLCQLLGTYLERYVAVQRAATADAYKGQLATIGATILPRPGGGSAPLRDWRLTDIVTDTIERYREVRRQRTGLTGVNRHLGSLRHVFNWAVRVGYVEKTPFMIGTQPAVILEEEPARTRRLQTGEGELLLARCAVALRAIVEAALETGMRRGEILSLQWSQVEGATVDTAPDGSPRLTWARRVRIFLPAVKTKTKADRRIPISARLRAILEMRRFDPDNQPMPAEAYVFGTAIGGRVKGFKRAWATAVLVSHGHKPGYTKTAALDAPSRAALGAINLHFHDLRREAGSRWLDGGVPLHTIRDWLGHTNIAQTSTYLSGTSSTEDEAMRQYEERVQARATDDRLGGHEQPSTADATVN